MKYLSPAVVLIAVALAGISCSTGDEGKMPVTTSSDAARNYYLQGRDLAEKLRNTEALDFFEKAVAEDSNFAMAWIMLAQGQPTAKGLLEYFERAKALADSVSEAERLQIMAVDAGLRSDPADREDLLRQLVATFPSDERAHNLLGVFYFGQQRFNLAVDEFRKAIDIAPDFSVAYNMLGYSYRFMDRFEEAEDALEKYVELIPDDPNPYDSYAELLMKMGKYEESIEYYRKALSVNPSFFFSHIGIASNLVFMGKHEEARAQLRRMYAAAADDGQRRAFRLAQAVTYLDEGGVERALKELDRRYAISESIEDITAMASDLRLIGFVLLETGGIDEAAAKFKEAAKLIKHSDLSADLKANYERAYLFSLARLAMKRGDFAAARAKAEHYRTQVENLGNQGLVRAAYSLSGQIALAERDYDQAIEDLLQADQQTPYNLFRLAQAYEGKRDKKAARKMYKRVADFNQLNSLDYALVRKKAREMLILM
jgi:tetratricopeptide (TPR) repeat protein